MENFIFGIRPLIEALQEGKIPEKIYLQKGLTGSNFQTLFQMIREMQAPFQMVPVEKLNGITRNNHQGVIAQIALVTYHKLESIIPAIYEKGETPLFVMLDGVTDVRNMGAIARTAECAGAHALILGEKSSAPVNADAIKTSSGAFSRLPVCRERDLFESVIFLKESGINVIACTEKSNISIYQAKLEGPVVLIMGSEDRGISKPLLMQADLQVSIPQAGKIASLNVSVATGVVLFEALRQRHFSF